MKGPDRAYILEITSTAEKWLTRCGANPRGQRMGHTNLRVALTTATNVRLDDKGCIRWRAGGQEWSAEPVLPVSPDVPT